MKSRYLKSALFVVIFSLMFIGCQRFDKLNTNPDLSLTVTPGMLATTLILDITRGELATTKGFMQPFMLDKYIAWTEDAEDLEYNKLGRVDFGSYVTLINVEKMINLSTEGGLKNSYTALGHFVRAWKFFNLTMAVGDIPYKEALQAESSKNIKPIYDSQKEVFLGILKELDEADNLFAKGSNFKGDPIYNGNITLWRKLVNTFQLNVLINLSKKTNDPDLNVINRFKDIVTNRPLFESNSDNFGLTYSDATGQKYPFSKPNQFTIYPIVSNVLIERLKVFGDRRLFYFAAPSPVKLSGGISSSDWNAYVGVDPSASYSDLGSVAGTKDYSTINDRYYLAAGEPICQVSYSQLKFLLAEASVRGWISGSAEMYYIDGIKAALKFVADNTPDDITYHHNMKITSTYIDSYPLSASVKFSSTTNAQLEQIMIQKFISSYLQRPFSTFYDNRRTGYPVLPVNPASNMNDPKEKLPKRWMYPQNELDYNTENVKAAITRQYSSDDSNGLIWILKD